MRFEFDVCPGVVRNACASHPRQLSGQRLAKTALPERHPLQRRTDKIRHWHEVLAQRLGQSTHQGQAFVVDQPGHQPFQPLLGQLAKQRRRHAQGDAIGRVIRLEVVGKRQRDPFPAPAIRVLLGSDLVGVTLQQILASHVQKLRIIRTGLFHPALETGQLEDIRRNARVEVAIQRLVIDQDVALARLGFQRIELLQQRLIGLVERSLAVPFAGDQRLANEDFPRNHRINRPEVHAALGHDDQTVQADLLVGYNLAALLLPVRLAVAGLDQMSRQRLDPVRVDLGGDTSVEAARLGQFGNHDPDRSLLRQLRGRMDHEPALTRAHVIALLGLVTQMTEQAGEQGFVHRIATGWLIVGLEAHVATGEQ